MVNSSQERATVREGTSRRRFLLGLAAGEKKRREAEAGSARWKPKTAGALSELLRATIAERGVGAKSDKFMAAPLPLPSTPQ